MGGWGGVSGMSSKTDKVITQILPKENRNRPSHYSDSTKGEQKQSNYSDSTKGEQKQSCQNTLSRQTHTPQVKGVKEPNQLANSNSLLSTSLCCWLCALHQRPPGTPRGGQEWWPGERSWIRCCTVTWQLHTSCCQSIGQPPAAQHHSHLDTRKRHKIDCKGYWQYSS